MDLMEKLKSVPKWVWIAGGGVVVVAAFALSKKSTSAGTEPGQSSDFTNMFYQLMDSLAQLQQDILNGPKAGKDGKDGKNGTGTTPGGGGGGGGGGSGSDPTVTIPVIIPLRQPKQPNPGAPGYTSVIPLRSPGDTYVPGGSTGYSSTVGGISSRPKETVKSAASHPLSGFQPTLDTGGAKSTVTSSRPKETKKSAAAHPLSGFQPTADPTTKATASKPKTTPTKVTYSSFTSQADRNNYAARHRIGSESLQQAYTRIFNRAFPSKTTAVSSSSQGKHPTKVSGGFQREVDHVVTAKSVTPVSSSSQVKHPTSTSGGFKAGY